MPSVPRISVVIPTFQRRELVVAAVEALARQTFDRSFEIIVAIDGSTDGTAEALQRLRLAAPLMVLEQLNAGAAAARNLGAGRARGEIILFLDDDMEADPNLLAEHDRFHRAGADAVLGHMPLHPASSNNLISQGVAEWANERLVRLSAPGATLGLHDLLTGQLSVSARVFREIRGFDTAFTRGGSFGNEDVDFGHRLLEGGYHIRFNPNAVSAQRYSVTPRQHLRQWHQAGHADVLFARKHPGEALSLFELNGLSAPFAKWVARPVSRLPFWFLFTCPARVLAYLVGSRSGALARYLFFGARALEYWRGVAEAGGIPRQKSLRILVYHGVSDLGYSRLLRPYGVPIDQFRRQIAALKAHGFAFIGPAEFAAFAEGRAGLPRRAVLLTFDDCYRDLLDVAPVLQAEGVGALAFAVSGQLGGTNVWDAKFGGPPLNLLDAQGLLVLRNFGVEIGAHSRTHRLLTELESLEIESEISGSIEDLEAAGLPRPRFFAFPYGEADARTRKIAAHAGLSAAFSVTPGVMSAGADRMSIPRIEVLRSDVGLIFVAKVLFAKEFGRAAALRQSGEQLWRRLVHCARQRIQRVLSPKAD